MRTVPILSPAECMAISGEKFISSSRVIYDGATFWLEADEQVKRLIIVAAADHPVLDHFVGERRTLEEDQIIVRALADAATAETLRDTLPWLRPRPLGMVTSAGFGDRLGLATPGHVEALRASLASAPGSVILPIFAQQSIREMARTHRTPQMVLDDATWGSFQAGWTQPQGADADHLKTTEDIDACVSAGFSVYTFDPGEYVASEADDATSERISALVDSLPWSSLETTRADLSQRLIGRTIDLDDRRLVIEEEALWRAAAKYGRAVAHVTALARHLSEKGIPYEIEISVDETETPTTFTEHAYISIELARLGIRWVGLAPRFVGAFEKGIDFIGDLDALRHDLNGHASLARALGPYKLSLHSGSDKFSVYPLIVEATRGLVHLKTAGTSYVEALRVVAMENPPLFHALVELARQQYPRDRVSYHVSAEIERMPDVTRINDADLPPLLDNADLRQALHVTYGSALAEYHLPLLATLHDHESEYDATLVRHFRSHLDPFVAYGKSMAGTSSTLTTA